MTKSLSKLINNVHHADCLTISQKLHDVDLIYADILYDEPPSEVVLWSFVSCLRSSGALWIQTDYRSVAKVKDTLDHHLDLEFINWCIWNYDWGGRPKDAFGRKHDDLLYYAKVGGKRTFNAKAVAVPKTVMMCSTKKWKIPTDVWTDIGNFYTTDNERIKVGGKNIKWQKPKRLLERIILACTNKNDLVFEPYLGTGTACVVAKELGRDYVGCDTNKVLVKIAKKRLHG